MNNTELDNKIEQLACGWSEIPAHSMLMEVIRELRDRIEVLEKGIVAHNTRVNEIDRRTNFMRVIGNNTCIAKRRQK